MINVFSQNSIFQSAKKKQMHLLFRVGGSILLRFKLPFISHAFPKTRPALSNQNVPVATFATFVATDSLLSPQLREMCCKSCNLIDLSTKI